MQEDFTVFKIPNQPRKQVSGFGMSGTETLRIGGVAMGTFDYRTTDEVFPLYKELNNIAEELEKCRLRNS